MVVALNACGIPGEMNRCSRRKLCLPHGALLPRIPALVLLVHRLRELVHTLEVADLVDSAEDFVRRRLRGWRDLARAAALRGDFLPP